MAKPDPALAQVTGSAVRILGINSCYQCVYRDPTKTVCSLTGHRYPAEGFPDSCPLPKSAPVALMDTRAALSVCALKEEDFPALYALQGHRVALVDLGPNRRAEGRGSD